MCELEVDRHRARGGGGAGGGGSAPHFFVKLKELLEKAFSAHLSAPPPHFQSSSAIPETALTESELDSRTSINIDYIARQALLLTFKS